MSNFERTTSWQQIQQGVKEAERLIVRKITILLSVKARQTLECMVRCRAEKGVCRWRSGRTIDSCMREMDDKRQRTISITSYYGK